MMDPLRRVVSFQFLLLVVNKFCDIGNNTNFRCKWCEECVRAISKSSAIKCASGGTALYLFKGIIHNRLVRELCDDIDSTLCSKLQECDKRTIIKECIQLYAIVNKTSVHNFILPLLASVKWTYIKNNVFLDIIVECERQSYTGFTNPCDMFERILSIVDELSDINSDITDHHVSLCYRCRKTMLLSSAVKSASRGTALYLIRGVISNDISIGIFGGRVALMDCMQDLIESTLCSKLEESDRLNVVKQFILPRSFTGTFGHDFLPPLLLSANWTHITNKAFLDIIMNFRRGTYDNSATCDMIQNIFLVVDKLGGISNDNTDIHGELCEKCTKTVLLSSAVHSAPRETVLYLIKQIIQIGMADYMHDVIESTLFTKLQEYDRLIIMKQLIQSVTYTRYHGHDFLLPLLSSANWAHITNEVLCDILVNIRRGNNNCSARCDVLQSILGVVDSMGDISIDNNDLHGNWCQTCAEAILMTSALESISRGTALYLIKGIIQNNITYYMHDVIDSPLYSKLEECDRIIVVKQLIQSDSVTRIYDGYCHAFLLPLLSSAKWSHITKNSIFDIIKCSRKMFGFLKPCDMLQSILLVVDHMSDINIDNIDQCDKWCVECTKAVLMSSAVKSASRGTALYLIKGIIHNGIEYYINDVIDSTLNSKLEEYDRIIVVKQLIQSDTFTRGYDGYGHDFLLPLLSSACFAHITNKALLDILVNFRRGYNDYSARCDMFQSILGVVDKVGDISIDKTDRDSGWCKECTKAILMSSAIKSASRGTALYLINGIIQNCILQNINGVITLGLKLQEYDIENVVKQLRQSGAYTRWPDHDFLQPLLSNATWTHKTNKEYLINLSRCVLFNDECCSRSALLRCILLNVEELSDIGSDERYRRHYWCEDCLREVLMSSAVKSASSGTSLYLINCITEINSEDIMHEVIESNICTNLEKSEKENCIQKCIQILRLPRCAGHTFLLPLLQSDTEKPNTNVIFDSNVPHDSCRWLRVILLLVDNLRDVEYKDTDCFGEWCTECIESLLKSVIVDSVSRRTALYFMKGIIQNEIKCQIDTLIQSPVFRKVNANDIIYVIKDSKKYNFYKLFLEQLPLSDTEVLHCIQHIINDESTHIGLELNAENDPVTAILKSKRAKIRSSRIFSEIIWFILTHDCKYSYSRVLCALSIDSAAAMSTSAIGELLVETLKQKEKCVGSDLYVKRKQSLELKHSCALILLSKLIKMVYDENTKSFAMITVTNVDHDSAYDLHIHDCPVITVGITFDRNWRTYSLSVSSLLSKYSEDDSVKALVNLISIDDCDIDKMLKMLLDSFSMTLCEEKIETLLIAIVETELNLLKQKDLMNEYEQPAFNTTRLMAVFGSKHGHVKLPQTSVIKIMEKIITSYVDSSEAIGIIADAQLSQGLYYESFRKLLKVTVNTTFISSTEYIKFFTHKMKVAKLLTNDAIELLTDCFKSMDDESKTVITILDMMEEVNVKQIILNQVIMDIIETNGVGNAATLDCLSQTRLFTKDMIATLVTNLVLKLRCTNTQIRVDYEKCSKTQCLLLKLLHVFLSYDTRTLNDITLIPIEKIHFAVRQSITITVSYDTKDIFKSGRFLSQLPDDDINEMFTLSMSLSKIPCNMVCALFHFQENPNISRTILVKITLKAVESEKLVNHIVLIMLQNYNKLKLTDEDMSVLMCAIIRRKYGGREEYMESLLSQSLSSHIGERSISEALCVAMSSVRNNEHIVSLIVSAAEELNVKLSEDKHRRILETLLECKHKRVTHYTRTILQSSISPEMSDKTFLAAVSTIMNHNLSTKELLHLILSHKPSLSQECRASLEGLKQTGPGVSRQHDTNDEDTKIKDADDKDGDYEIRGNDCNSVKSQDDDDERINDDDSVIHVKERTDGELKQTEVDHDVIHFDNGSVSMQIDEGQRKKDNDAEMSDEDDDNVLDKINDHERIRFIDDILTHYS